MRGRWYGWISRLRICFDGTYNRLLKEAWFPPLMRTLRYLLLPAGQEAWAIGTAGFAAYDAQPAATARCLATLSWASFCHCMSRWAWGEPAIFAFRPTLAPPGNTFISMPLYSQEVTPPIRLCSAGDEILSRFSIRFIAAALFIFEEPNHRHIAFDTGAAPHTSFSHDMLTRAWRETPCFIL